MVWQGPTPDQFRPSTIPSAIGGLNAYDSLVAMGPTDAIMMRNWWPQPYGALVRKGYAEWAIDMPGTVESLAGWVNVDGSKKLFAWSVDSMYDISTRASVGAALVTGLTNARWEHVTVTNSAGGHLICVNGADNGIIYNSSGVARLTLGDGIVVNTWAGLDPSNAAQVTVHQRRLWAVQRDTSRGWYLPPDAVQGTFVSFDFGPQFSKGGHLQYLSTWTLDDGGGAQNLLVAMSSQGEAVVYTGSNPSDPNDWFLVGVYYVGAPVAGRRSFTKAGGDMLVLTQRGLVSMTGELVSTKVADAEQPLTSRKVQFLLSELVAQYTTLNGWHVIYHAPLNMALINVPSVTAGGNAQLAANMIIESWTQFINMDAACWLSYNDQLYFGDYSGNVYQAWTGYSDRVLLDNTGGEGVATEVQQAYNYFGGTANNKQVGLYRPNFVTSGEVSFNCAIVYDFAERDIVQPGIVPLPLGSLWGTGLWGSAFWSGGSTVKKNWLHADGMGAAISFKMRTLSNAEVLWVATDYTVVQGSGVL